MTIGITASMLFNTGFVYPMMINIDLREVFNVRKHAAAVGLARVFFGGSVEYAIGFYFIALIPSSGMTAA